MGCYPLPNKVGLGSNYIPKCVFNYCNVSSCNEFKASKYHL